MSTRTLNFSDEVIEYLRTRGLREPPVLTELRARTAELSRAGMQISPEQGALMANLVRMSGARKTIEVGTFTGYSALVVALAMPEDGKVVACDVSEEWTSIAREFWKKAGVAERIELHLQPAVETLDALIDGGEAGTFDFAFIDADKSNYDAYYERCLTLLRSGGAIGVDNVLWGGSVVDESRQDEDVSAIRALNDKIRTDERVDISMVPVGDGLTLAIKR
ncbi:MAG: class I SAM-dependent methyltransferase [Pseudomonadales bacterium]|nr:class I SAM-dependent methyltransferase [Pseudomonadales bacterium]